jgi:hypothetical protein
MPHESDTSFAALLSSALSDVRELFRQEISLARYEVREEIGRAASAGVALGAASVVLLFAALFLLVALALGFAVLVGWDSWAGFLAVGIALAITGAALFFSARSRLRAVKVVPPQTARTIKEDVEWLKQQTRSVRE